MKAINWNNDDNQIAKTYYKQLVNQFWVPEKFKVSRDLRSWSALTNDQRETYIKVLSGLTGLDYHQGSDGMPLIEIHHDNKFEQAVFANMTFMESIHAKAYSYIFETLISKDQSNHYLGEWVENQPQLQRKYNLISHYYYQLYDKKENVTVEKRYMAMVASVFLETFSFYSGFFYPIYLAGQGKMIASGEIIRKIIQDESIHGSFTGFVAQRLHRSLDNKSQVILNQKMYSLLNKLLSNEIEYTHNIYDKIGLTRDVINYVKYNANRALQNLGFDEEYEHDPVNQIVLNGIDTGTVNHDFFSTTGDYVIPLNIEPLKDEDFEFDDKKG